MTIAWRTGVSVDRHGNERQNRQKIGTKSYALTKQQFRTTLPRLIVVEEKEKEQIRWNVMKSQRSNKSNIAVITEQPDISDAVAWRKQQNRIKHRHTISRSNSRFLVRKIPTEHTRKGNQETKNAAEPIHRFASWFRWTIEIESLRNGHEIGLLASEKQKLRSSIGQSYELVASFFFPDHVTDCLTMAAADDSISSFFNVTPSLKKKTKKLPKAKTAPSFRWSIIVIGCLWQQNGVGSDWIWPLESKSKQKKTNKRKWPPIVVGRGRRGLEF